jgi:hypothetical protein
MHKLKRETVRAPAVSGSSHEPLAETVRPPPDFRPSLEGKVAVRVSNYSGPINHICSDEGEGTGGIDYGSFFENPRFTADILVIADIQALWDDAFMHRFAVSLEIFKRANPRSAVVVDASASPLFKGLFELHEEGKINAIIDSPPGGGRAIAIGLEILSILR